MKGFHCRPIASTEKIDQKFMLECFNDKT